MERKCVADCVQYYYLSKKTQNYRQLLRKSRARTRNQRTQQNNTTANANANNSHTLNIPPVKTETTNGVSGVTTRGQKEQKIDPQGPSVSSTNTSVSNSVTNALNETNPVNPPPATTPTNIVITPNNESVLVNPLPATPRYKTNNKSSVFLYCVIIIGNAYQTLFYIDSSEYSGQPRKKRKEESKDALMNEIDTSEEENLDLNGKIIFRL